MSFTQKDHRAVRSRVVNRKRTDLSKLLRRKVQADVHFRSPFPFLMGHTRFATSSKSTLDGTHPHRWTAPSMWRMYDFNVPRKNTAGFSFEAKSTRVENYVTHK